MAKIWSAWLVEEQVEVAEVGPAQVPVEVLGLEVEREHVRQDRVHHPGDIARRSGGQVSRRGEGGPLNGPPLFDGGK